MDAGESEKPVPMESRIRWEPADEEAIASPTQNTLSRFQTNSSQISIHSTRSRRNTIDPANALPIQYRTVLVWP